MPGHSGYVRFLSSCLTNGKASLISSSSLFLLLVLCKPMEKYHSITGATLGYMGGAARNQERKDELPNAVDLSHHLSEESKNRQPSALKTFYRYWRKPGVIGLAGGMEYCRWQPVLTCYVIFQACHQRTTSLSIR